jgi:hypothetical protein
MKTTLIPAGILFLLFLSSCRNDLTVEQLPPGVIKSVPCATLYSRILELFPEHTRNSREVLFNDTVQKKVVLTKDSEVYVTFISEGAGYRNTFGWYTYDKNSPPSSAAQLELNVLFPDVSDQILKPGYRLLLSKDKFKAGTVIGFFLIVDGWNEGTINYDNPKVYTDHVFNPDKKQQHILFEEKTCGDIVLAFEDLSLGDPKASDHDFNDILFTVSDNNSEKVNTAFDVKGIASW